MLLLYLPIHEWLIFMVNGYIYLCLVDFYGKCQVNIPVPWILMGMILALQLYPLKKLLGFATRHDASGKSTKTYSPNGGEKW